MERPKRNIERVEEWIELYQDDLYRYAFFRLGSRADAEDILQDAFVKVATSEREITNPKAYLYSTVMSGCVDMLRRRVKTKFVDEITAAPLQSVEQEAEEEFSRIDRLLSRLPEMQREVIHLHIHSNLKFTEIAEVLNTPVSTVKSRFTSGIERLKQLFFN